MILDIDSSRFVPKKVDKAYQLEYFAILHPTLL